ncbi:MAG: hypothetical protein HKM93_07545 [Desulfobacteraceae bacterium]|nr:hypothetical protein [Desulfobacteraceae bacterium]
MPVNGINSIMSAGDQPKEVAKNVMGKDEFLNLLVAQLKHQDPLNPMDSTGFTAQLAQFSSLEQLQNVNDNLNTMGSSQSLMANSQAVNYIGKTITARGDGLNVDGGYADDIRFDLQSDAAAVFVNVYDATGNFVRNIEAGAMVMGEQSIPWDGLDQAGNQAMDGSYFYEVNAIDIAENEVGVDTFTTGTITGVNFRNGSAYLLAGSMEIPLDQVISVIEPENTKETNTL